jgi:hypothetical protein
MRGIKKEGKAFPPPLLNVRLSVIPLGSYPSVKFLKKLERSHRGTPNASC